MKTLPAFATALLIRLGPEDESIAGDLAEAYRAGRSRGWYWREVLWAVALTPISDFRARPLRGCISLSAGWAALLLLFTVFGDATANGLAGWLWNWNRMTGYSTHVWWPFWVTAAFVSYSGFALSALAIVSVNGRRAAPLLIGYAASVFVALLFSAVVIEVLTRRNGGVPVPHPLFYLVSVGQPTHWRSGLLLAPATILGVAFACQPLFRPRPQAAGLEA